MATASIRLGGGRAIVKGLAAIPEVFSPNDDGRLDVTRMDFEVTEPSSLVLEILDSNHEVKRTFGLPDFSDEKGFILWDGKDEKGDLVPDGFYREKLVASPKSNPSAFQTEYTTVVVDTEAPSVALAEPPNDSYLRGDVAVRGTISDPNLQEYTMGYFREGAWVAIDGGNQNRANHTFAHLRDLPEGDYILVVRARDLAENRIDRYFSFVVDRTAPQLRLQSPQEGNTSAAEKMSFR